MINQLFMEIVSSTVTTPITTAAVSTATTATDNGGGVLDYIIITIVIIGAIAIFYKALKEPLNLLFGYIGNGFQWLGNKMGGVGAKTMEVITYE